MGSTLDAAAWGARGDVATRREQVAAELMDVVDLARSHGSARDMIAALREVGLICGYYEQPEEAKVHPNISAKRSIDIFETMSDAELTSMVREKEG